MLNQEVIDDIRKNDPELAEAMQAIFDFTIGKEVVPKKTLWQKIKDFFK